MSRLADKQQRCELVNQAIRIIASYGRQFFYCKSQDTWASMEVDARGRVWFVDQRSRARIYTHEATFGNDWNGFTHGGTLRNLVELFRDYIRTGQPLHPGYLGHEREDGSNIWGYEPEALATVRAQAGALAMFRQPEGTQ
ncbi:hypothetical protein [Pseudomonas oryzihabitans]|uniref:hypothetical protein n=1 Tax=Pseudomonas oryzihabitans TaxID=47885 RepID=UPI0028A77D5B|nr:hypothetical protein [Pseudomonas oryzihabitans]